MEKTGKKCSFKNYQSGGVESCLIDFAELFSRCHNCVLCQLVLFADDQLGNVLGLLEGLVELVGVQTGVDGKVVEVGVDGLVRRQRVQVEEFGLDENEGVGGRVLPEVDEMAGLAEAEGRVAGEDYAWLVEIFVELGVDAGVD